MEQPSFARDYEIFMENLLQSERLATSDDSTNKLYDLKNKLETNGFNFSFGKGKRSIVSDIVNGNKTYHVSIIIAYDGFEILITMVGGETGHDVRNEKVSTHDNIDGVIEELNYFKNTWIHIFSN